MMSIRVGLGSSLRRAAFSRPTLDKSIILKSMVARRTIQTQSITPAYEEQVLNKQRLLRPNSPHTTIYRPQMTSVLSIFHRIAGTGLSVLLYGFGLGYLLMPGYLDSAHIIDFIAGLPEIVKYTGKFILAAPFSFHFFNGVRHLVWDTGKFITVKGMYKTGYAMLGATAISTVALMMM